jgi:hypothetical protein
MIEQILWCLKHDCRTHQILVEWVRNPEVTLVGCSEQDDVHVARRCMSVHR